MLDFWSNNWGSAQRAHQLPNVTVCYKHNAQLYQTDNDTLITNIQRYKTLYSDLLTPASYAAFSNGMLRAKADANLWILQYALIDLTQGGVVPQKKPFITHKFDLPPLLINPQRICYPLNNYTLMQIFQTPEKLDDFMDRYKNFILARRSNIFGCLEYIKSFKYIDTDYQVLLKNLEIYYDSIKDFFIQAKNDYDIFLPFRTTLTRMRHKTCGTTFYTTPIGFLAGMKCPKCIKN